MSPRRAARWERTRRHGVTWYVLVWVVLGWSVPGAAWGIVEATVWHGRVVTRVALWCVVSTIVGVPYQLVMWRRSERRYNAFGSGRGRLPVDDL